MHSNQDLIVELATLDKGENAKIHSFEGGESMIKRLHTLGLVEGLSIKKISSLAFKGPVILLVNRAQIAIGYKMAKKIKVALF